MGKVGYVCVLVAVVWVVLGGEWVGCFGQGLGGWCGVMSVCVVSLVYCARRIPAHLRCTQCSILLHLIDICFLTCICLWQTCLRVVVGPGFVSTSSDFMRSIASHPAGPHDRLAQKNGREWSSQFAQGLPDRCDSSTACRLFCLEPSSMIPMVFMMELEKDCYEENVQDIQYSLREVGLL